MLKAHLPKRFFSTIRDLKAREILDSRGFPTIEVDLYTETHMYRSSVPSGKSTGFFEVAELRDRDQPRYGGIGVLTAANNVMNIIKPAVLGRNVTDQQNIDKLMIEELDGTSTRYGYIKAKLGGNAILGVSLCLARAGADDAKLPLYAYIAQLANKKTNKFILPVPAFNVINGGIHAGNRLPIQEFLIFPVGAATYSEALRIGTEVYHSLKKIIKEKHGLNAVNVGDQGGFAPNIKENEEAFDLILEALESSGYKKKVKLGIDAAAQRFYSLEHFKYNLDFKNPETDESQMIIEPDLEQIYLKYVKKYQLVSIEDPYFDDHWWGTEFLTQKIGKKVQVIGDDLLTTNPIRVKKAIKENVCNGLVIEMNQIGTLTESIEACLLAQKAGWGVMVSHRCGDTEDSFISDLCVGLGAGQIKAGAPCRSERLAKYNQLLRIEEELGARGKYAGEAFRTPKV
ncbi:unnamed protein product [Blepharisma stoltei]|uniref:phosphopyruvate hydratase n=1 Tax=Blepharisma stoltei TaxID=1481888 RepID=A0AAU9K966_9CILI|nr:unnamed protein product [Blepharisma stoltei]